MPGGGESQGLLDDDDILDRLPLSDQLDAGTRCGYDTSLGNSVIRVVGPSLDIAVPRPRRLTTSSRDEALRPVVPRAGGDGLHRVYRYAFCLKGDR